MEKVKYNRHEYRTEYLKSNEWKTLRDLIMATSPRCQICGNRASDVHHMVYRNIVDITINDLIPVCRKCHDLIHQAIDDGWISQNPVYFNEIKSKTLNILNDNNYKKYRDWLTSKHYLSGSEIDQVKNLQSFIIKKISGMLKRNIWYDILPETKFTGRQILKIRQMLKMAQHRRNRKVDKPDRKIVLANKPKIDTMNLKDLPGFKSRKQIKDIDIN